MGLFRFLTVGAIITTASVTSLQAGDKTSGLTLSAQPPQRANEDDAWAARVLTERFVETLKLIKPQPGESRWMEIPWQTSLWTARQKAATEGKPMFVWSGSGGAPCAPT